MAFHSCARPRRVAADFLLGRILSKTADPSRQIDLYRRTQP